MEIIQIIINALLGGGLLATLIFYRSKRRTAAAQATTAEVEAIKGFATEWKEIADARDVSIAENNKKIDALYVSIGEWRDKFNAKSDECQTIKLDNQSLKFRLCNKRGCEGREPQTGF
ncbi:MAG: hypothetical protein RRY42_07955 [Mucinivorans sp.]